MNKTSLFILIGLLLSYACLGQSHKLSGTIVSSMPLDGESYAENAFDGNPATSFVASDASMSFVGLDLGAPHVITSVTFVASHTATSDSTMLLGLFEGANSPDFMDALPLRCITEVASRKEPHTLPISVTRGFRYVRYVGPANQNCAISELSFSGYEGEGVDSIFYQVTNLPTLSIHTKNNVMPLKKKVDIESQMTLVYENGTQIQEYPILTRPRGNFSFSAENKPYRIKFNDEKKHHIMTNSEADKSPAKKKKWVLINNYSDKSLMRNHLAFEVARMAGMAYVPYSKAVDLFVNGEYRGNYIIADHLDVDKHRIDIDEMTAEDTEGVNLTGGYFLEYDGYAKLSEIWMNSLYDDRFTVRSPDEDVVIPSQLTYIKLKVDQFFSSVFAENYRDSIEGYQKYLDLESFMKYFLVSEFNGNYDMLWQWFWLKKRGDERFHIGPIWDAEWGMNNNKSLYPQNERADWTYTINHMYNAGPLVNRILSDPKAYQFLENLWASVRDSSYISKSKLNLAVDSCVNMLQESQRLHFTRWDYLGRTIGLNAKAWRTWEEDVETIRSYLAGRVDWMDRKLNYHSLRQTSGIYQIDTPAALVAFSEIVNNGETDAKAELCNDIDMSLHSERFNPIGTFLNPFKGSFDGKHFQISNLYIEGGEYVGVFGNLGDNAHIQDVYLAGSCRVLGRDYVGSLVGNISGRGVLIQGCGNEATISSTDGCASGLIGNLSTDAECIIEICFNRGSVYAATIAGDLIVERNKGVNLISGYNTGNLQGNLSVSENVLQSNVSDAASGSLCFQLNEALEHNSWYQNIDNGKRQDLSPVPISSHAKVYFNEGKYSNVGNTINPYRYYQLLITANKGDKYFQISEFDLLNDSLQELSELRVYGGAGEENGKQGWSKVADNDVSTKYCVQKAKPIYMLFDAGENTYAAGYRMYTANDTQTIPGRNPYSWKLYGSTTYTENKDDSCWQIIDERTEDNAMGAENYTPYDFIFPQRVESVLFNTNSLNMYVGETDTVAVSISPKVMENTLIEYYSTDESVAVVSPQGVVTAINEGSADIVAKLPYCGNVSTKLPVNVDGSDIMGFRYYLLKIDEIQGQNVLQFSEFNLLDSSLEPISGISSYDGQIGSHNGQSYDKLTDGDLSTKLCTPFCGNASYFFDAGDIIAPYGYRMYTANDTKNYPLRNPKSWSLWGSNTKSHLYFDSCWVLLDNRDNDCTMGNVNFTPYDFYFDNGTDASVESIRINRPVGFYDLTGRKVQSPSHGVYIEVAPNGMTRKILK